MASPQQPSVQQMLDELRQRAVGPKEPFDPIGTAKRNLTGMVETAKRIPSNIQRMAADPVAYAQSIPAPTGDQIMNAMGPGNVGMAGIMIGPKAKTWNAVNAAKAEAMERAGAKPEQIWYETGTYRGPEGKWRQEIDDSKAVHRRPEEIKSKAQQLQDQQAMLKAAARESLAHGKEVVSDLFPKEAVAARQAVKKQVSNIDDELGGYFGLKADPKRGNYLKYGYEHPELYAAYPELADYVIAQGKKGDPGVLGSMSGKDLELYQAGLNQKQPSSTVAHELQHAIQAIEGTPRGGNTYEFMDARRKAEMMIALHNGELSNLAKAIDLATDPVQKSVLRQQYDERIGKREKLVPYTQMDPHQEYRKLGGEAESRMIQERLNMTPEERAKTFPLESYDKDLDIKNLRLLDQGEPIDIYKAQGGTVNAFDYENPKHVSNVANIASKHKDFNRIPDVVNLLSDTLSQGSYKMIEDPRIQQAIKQAGHTGYFVREKGGKESHIIRKADGGTVPTIEQIKAEMLAKKTPVGLSQLQSVGVEEAPSLGVKSYIPPMGRPDNGEIPVGGVDTHQGDLPVGGVDMSKMNPGQQLMPQNGMQPNPQPAPQGMPGAPGQPPMGGLPSGAPDGQAQAGGSSILQLTPQGQAMAAMGGGQPPQPPQGLAKGGQPSVEQMKSELASKDEEDDEEAKAPSTRLTIHAEGPGGVKGIVVPHHMLHGRSWISKKTGKKVVVPGMNEINKARAQVYGAENRDPLNIGQIGRIHQQTLEEHFKKPVKEQLATEQAATNKLRAAKHLGEKANTLDKSEKLDTVNHEHDEKGRTYIGFASKGVAGHALYTSGHGENMKHHVLNTCPGQTAGCGGGTDEHGIVDTSKGTCFAPNAESQYVHAAVRRSTHEQAKHDPAMTKDWILAHTGSLRQAAKTADKKNKVLLFRPNVVDETDVSSRHVIRHLNEQRKAEGKPGIVANSYGKTTELHDPENGYYVTHSNVGPKTKKGSSISENIDRDQQRVRQTILGTKNKKGDDLVNVQGNKTPPKNSYMVTDVKRNSPFDKKMQSAITHAKYWSTGRSEHELSDEEKKEGPEGHFSGSGRSTTPDKAHYGHETHEGLRYDYQKQHILHPRLVQVGKNKDGTPHMIPTDSRFKDEEFLPKNRFKTKTGKVAGAILMTTPTESTSNVGHQTSFTHHVGEQHIEHALKNNGEYEIDKPQEQIKSAGKEYVPPQPINFMKKLASGGSVSNHENEDFDGHMAFPEQSFGAQHRLAYRHDPEEAKEIGDLPYHAGARNIRAAFGTFNHRPKVAMHNDLDTMAYELSRKTKAK
jgi:hypothetical protein